MSMSSTAAAPTAQPSASLAASTSAEKTHWLLILACSVIMVVEGFDLLIFSNAIPSMLTDASLGLNKASIGTVGSMIFVGMLIGGLLAGKTNDAFGLIKCMAAGFVVFTLATACIGWAQAGWQIGALRFLAGLGLGVVLPTGMSMARKHAKAEHSALSISIVMLGIPVGGMLAAVVSHSIIPAFGWRPLFLSGGVLGALVLLIIGPYLAKIDRADRAATPTAGRAAQPAADWTRILHGASRTILIAGIAATLADLLTWYGVSVWLTQLMREFDVPFTGAMQLMFTLNVGAIVGSLMTATLAIRLGTRNVAAVAGVIACGCLLLIASRTLANTGMFIAIAVLGMSAISAQNLLNALVSDAFPVQYRAAAMGMTLGLGRLGAVMAPALGGYILAGGYGPSWVLVVFAISALLGTAVLVVFSPARVQASVQALSARC